MTPEQILQYATQLRLPLTNKIGGYGEVTIERPGSHPKHKWAVTDGSITKPRFWVDANGGWTPASDLSYTAAWRLTLDEALELGQRVVEIESACLEAGINAIRDR